MEMGALCVFDLSGNRCAGSYTWRAAMLLCGISTAALQEQQRAAMAQRSPHEDGQQNVNIHLENGVPVYQDMGMNMQVQPPALFSSTCAKHIA